MTLFHTFRWMSGEWQTGALMLIILETLTLGRVLRSLR